ncbi:MAG: hypothetical protein J7604_20705 [Sporocytophaga sp.]|uniref:hypothetical protein n=1 Tax=Sporocytophaga sp. TaxID=2231183 RepID=UPI001B1EB13A|nr:hypothetical protein [Sporocytophaga sp.]MBO9702645.1 hypothetical protein [Sporocytophaga sp.]
MKYLYTLLTAFIFLDFTSRSNEFSPFQYERLYYRKDKPAKLAINKELSHAKGFPCDSVVGMDYIGFEGEHVYMPIGKNGYYISSIKKTQKLSASQIVRLNKILGNKKTYENPSLVACYEPRLAFIFYKKGEVIAQTQICLSCAQLRSTAKLAGDSYGDLMNQNAINEFYKLTNELGLTN